MQQQALSASEASGLTPNISAATGIAFAPAPSLSMLVSSLLSRRSLRRRGEESLRDRAEEVVLDFVRQHALHDVLRLVTLEHNPGRAAV
ncbi:hypothetical protein PG994_013489 [Apiospora phragmitis]|uniref:Uncharacterized protein n=1 Tax=Apiospora phragmitis TaxID=2905665 RepID=A0ABR1T8S0_9PEZI